MAHKSSSPRKVSTSVEVCFNYLNQDYVAEVEVNYTSGREAKISGPPENCYPAEPAEFNLEGSLVLFHDDGTEGKDRQPILLSDELKETILEYINEHCEDQILDKVHDAMDYQDGQEEYYEDLRWEGER